jgi:mannosyltransferase OCH1-like enzyme
MVRRSPDHTPSAIELLIALRQAGSFQGQAAHEDEASRDCDIPRRIVQFWDKSKPPADVKTMMQSWQDLHPDFEYVLFDDRAARAFLGERYPVEVLSAYGHARYPTAKADLCRLAYLYAKGGLYVDADDCCRGPLSKSYRYVASLCSTRIGTARSPTISSGRHQGTRC